MDTLSICASKGGVGKTTLAACFAVLAEEDGLKVALIDLDPQQSLARWWELRGQPNNPVLVSSVDTVTEAIDVLSKNGFDLVIIDTAPAMLTHINPAIENADLLVIPVKPSPLDVEAVDPVVKLAKKFKCPFVFVFNMVSPKSKLVQGAREYLEVDGEVLGEVITSRDVFAGAMIDGRTAPEVDRVKSRLEMTALWTAIKIRLRKRVSKIA